MSGVGADRAASGRPGVLFAHGVRSGDLQNMAADPKSTPPSSSSLVKQRDHGIRIFTYPKVIFIFPSLVAALICGIGMKLVGDDLTDPVKVSRAAAASASARQAGGAQPAQEPPPLVLKHQRFMRTPNLLGVLFLGIFAFNLLIMA